MKIWRVCCSLIQAALAGRGSNKILRGIVRDLERNDHHLLLRSYNIKNLLNTDGVQIGSLEAISRVLFSLKRAPFLQGISPN